MKQGEIWKAYFDPVKGSEQAGNRPVVIISGNVLNTHLPIVLCCPLTTQIKNFQGNVVLQANRENGVKAASEILTFHVRSLSKERLKEKIGNISAKELKQIHACLNDILRY